MGTSCRTCATRPEPAEAKRVTPGKPFEECPSCGAYVPRAEHCEWATMGPRLKARNVLHCLGTGLLGGALVAAVWALQAMVRGTGATWTGAGLAFALGLAVAGGWRGYWLAEAIRRSKRRMGDPMYTARLVEFELERIGAGPATEGATS